MVYGYNSLKKIYPASTTKILTALTAVTYGDLDQSITVSKFEDKFIELCNAKFYNFNS